MMPSFFLKSAMMAVELPVAAPPGCNTPIALVCGPSAVLGVKVVRSSRPPGQDPPRDVIHVTTLSLAAVPTAMTSRRSLCSRTWFQS